MGIQIGRPSANVTNILLALDATLDVAHEAQSRRANLIVTHHPLLFQPLRSVSPSSRAGEIALYLAEERINLYSAHTNLDHVSGGVSFAIASLLGLKEVNILAPLPETLMKVAVFVPASHLETVAKAMHEAGGGRFPNYEECSFRTEGVGTFKGSKESAPFIGKKEILEHAAETKLEILAEGWKLGAVLDAMLAAHPYEEVAYDIYPLRNLSRTFGLGAVGKLPKPISAGELLSLVKRRLGSRSIRYTGRLSRPVKRVAVCGGAGSALIPDAIRAGADAFITGDVKYHGFQDAERDLCLIDAGHFETERHILPVLQEKVTQIVRKFRSRSKVYVTRRDTNPVSYY